MQREAQSPPQAWEELRALAQDESNERGLLERLIELWRDAFAAQAAALYTLEPDGLALVVAAGDGLPASLPLPLAPAGDTGAGDLHALPMPAGRLCFRLAAPGAAAPDGAPSHPLSLLLASALR